MLSLFSNVLTKTAIFATYCIKEIIVPNLSIFILSGYCLYSSYKLYKQYQKNSFNFNTDFHPVIYGMIRTTYD